MTLTSIERNQARARVLLSVDVETDVFFHFLPDFEFNLSATILECWHDAANYTPGSFPALARLDVPDADCLG